MRMKCYQHMRDDDKSSSLPSGLSTDGSFSSIKLLSIMYGRMVYISRRASRWIVV